MLFEIMFNDLKPSTQAKFLEAFHLTVPEEGDFDIFPIAFVENDDEDI